MRILRRRSIRKFALLLVATFVVLSTLMWSPLLLFESSNKQVEPESKQMEPRDVDVRKLSDNSTAGSTAQKSHIPSAQPIQDPPHDHTSHQPHQQQVHQQQVHQQQPSHNIQGKNSHIPTNVNQKSQELPSPRPQSRHSSEPPSAKPASPDHKPVAAQHVSCKKPHCAEFLSRADLTRQKACLVDVTKNNRNVPSKELQTRILENDCNFMNGDGRDPVALVSAEGSGNTWVRGLLERASGVCTGFNFCDYVMRMKGFIGDNINSGSVLVVKTHMDKPQWVGETLKKPVNKFEAKYGSGIFLMRNPYDSLIAEWNRRLTNNVMIKEGMEHNESHTNVAPKELWFSKDWDEFLHTYMNAWLTRLRNWVLNQTPEHPVVVVKYEDLKKDTMTEVEKILTFLGFSFDENYVSQRLAEDFTMFKRPHSKESEFERYTGDQLQHMKSVVLQAIKLVEEKLMTHVVKLDDYLDKYE